MKKVSAFLKNLNVHPLILIIAGAILVLWPNAPWDTLVRLIGVFALIWGGPGLWQVFSGSKKEPLKDPSFLPSCAAAAVGVWMLCSPRFFEGILPVIVGIAWLCALRSIVSHAGALDSGFRGTAGTVLTVLAVTVAWVVGYLTFFAGGKWLQARSSGNTRIRDAARTPTLVYGAVTLVAVVCALLLQPHLLAVLGKNCVFLLRRDVQPR